MSGAPWLPVKPYDQILGAARQTQPVHQGPLRNRESFGTLACGVLKNTESLAIFSRECETGQEAPYSIPALRIGQLPQVEPVAAPLARAAQASDLERRGTGQENLRPGAGSNGKA